LKLNFSAAKVFQKIHGNKKGKRDASATYWTTIYCGRDRGNGQGKM